MAQIRKVERSFASKVPVAQMHMICGAPNSLSFPPSALISSAVLIYFKAVGEKIIAWNANIQGKSVVAKEVMEMIDKKNNRIVYKGIEGGPLDYYKSFTWIFQASPDDNVVHWTLEYEKDDEDVPEPTAYLDLLLFATGQVHAHLITGL